MKHLVLVQSNQGVGHANRAKALGEYLTTRLIVTRPFTGKSTDTEFFGHDKVYNDLYQDYREYDPDVIITEGYPFGRYGWDPFWAEQWGHKWEHGGVLDILEHAKENNKKIYSLDRDIPWIQPKEMYFYIDRLNEYYDGVFFAGDYNFLDATEQLYETPMIDCEVYNTGYITYPYTKPSVDKRDGILVSGGDWYKLTHKYQRLFLEVKEAIPSLKISFIIGDKTPKDILKMAENRDINLIKRPSVNEFRDYLSVHKMAFTSLGYMTFTDLNITKTPALVVPNEYSSSELYDVNNNVIGNEETYRTSRYSDEGGCHWIPQKDLDIDLILGGIEETMKIKQEDIPDIDLDGGEYIKQCLIEKKIKYI